MNNIIEERKKKRFQFLREIYELSEANSSIHFDPFEVGKKLGFDDKETELIRIYLLSEGLMISHEVTIGISHKGIVETEQVLTNPNVSTEHFPPFNIIIGNVTNSQIQQASPGARQRQELTVTEYFNVIVNLIEQSPNIPQNEKQSLINKIKEITNNPYISGIATNAIFETIKRILGI